MADTAQRDPRLRSNWGTIIEPPFPLGGQKLGSGQVIEISERLHTTETKSRVAHKQPQDKPSSDGKPKSEVQAIVERLSAVTKPPPESKRVGAIADTGILNSYAWKGWKTSDTIHQD